MCRHVPFLLALLYSLPPLAAMDVVRDGQATATIVVPDKALPAVKSAAEELVYHIELATGAGLSIVRESERPRDGALVFVGGCQATAEAGIDTAGLPPNGFVLKLVGDRFFLVGDDSDGQPAWVLHNNRTRVGTLFAVYEFLERHLDCRWLWPGKLGEVIPRRRDILVGAWDQTGAPAFIHTRWRDGGRNKTGTEGWASGKNRSRFLAEQGKWLRRNRFAMGVNMDMAHAFTRWWDRHKDDHREFFNLLPDGTRRSDPNYHGGPPRLISMCVSEPGFHKAIVENWQKRRSPQRPHIDMSENDTAGRCTCPNCMAWDVPDPELEAPWAQRLERAKQAFEADDRQWVKHLGSLSDRYARFNLAVQKEAEKIDPSAVVMGYAYANYVDPPRETKLNDRVVIGVVPPMYFPWTDAIRQSNRERWDGWRATGARMHLRPNWMLDGHNLPMIVARKLGKDFRYFAHHGMIGTDFDSLTGQYSTQGPNLYMLARLHNRHQMSVDDVLDEYFSAFGKARDQVRAYFDHWEQICDAVTEKPEGLHWSYFYRQAHVIFTPAAMARGRELLDKAMAAARGDAAARGGAAAEARVVFLRNGLRNAELTLAAQAAYVGYREAGGIKGLRSAVDRLDAFRRSVESDLICNMAFLAWAEARTWDRRLLRVMRVPGQQLPDPWQFQWDPKERGVREKWFAEDADTSAWLSISTDGPWEVQPVGKQWREEHRVDYDGFAWYRTTFEVKREAGKPQVRLVFGAVDEACVIWVNGRQLLERPFPYKGDRDSWQKAFELDITEAVRYDRPNTLAVRVEDNGGAGGIWRRVWLLKVAPVNDERSIVKNGGFEGKPIAWRKSVMCGKFAFELDRENAHNGAVSARLQCTKVAGAEAEKKHRTRSWGRWYQTGVPVDKGKTYTLRLWAKTSSDFAGTVSIWVTGDAKQGTVARNLVNTQGLWHQVVATGITPKSDAVGIYLNIRHGTGTAWFDDVELVPEGTAP